MKYEYFAPNLASFPGRGVNRPDPLNKKAAKGLCPGGLTFLRASLNPFDNFPTPAGAGRVEEWENQGWDKDDAIAYLNAYYANLILPAQQIYLRSRPAR